MTRIHEILGGPFFVALLGTIFCIWSALGNDVNICVSTGCTLYEDFSIAGISLWWFGTGAFSLLCVLALLGQAMLGSFMAALFLLGDICLLLLMMLTAPCISCLVVAIFFAISYMLFRMADQAAYRNNSAPPRRFSPLLWVWLALFVVILGQVVRSQMDIWPILDESGDSKSRMFFSPSCRYCVEGINVLSGNVNMAFYPVADNESDVHRLAKMIEYLDKGMNLAEALGQSQDTPPGGFWSNLGPDMLLLRFRLLCNKAHVLAAGSRGVPFFENKGLPPDVLAKVEERKRGPFSRLQVPTPPSRNEGGQLDATLPVDTGGQCGGRVPCPPANP